MAITIETKVTGRAIQEIEKIEKELAKAGVTVRKIGDSTTKTATYTSKLVNEEARFKEIKTGILRQYADQEHHEKALRELRTQGLIPLQKQLNIFGKIKMALGAIGITVGIIAATRAIKNMVIEAIDAQARIYDLTKMTGMGAEFLSAFKYVAEQSGASIESFATGMRFLARNMFMAEEGGKAIASIFKDELNIDVLDSNKKL